MARRFRGQHLQKVDAKGRVSVPARFRRVLEAGDPDWRAAVAEGQSDARPQFVIVYGDESQKYLECYSIEAIEEVDELIEEMPRGSEARLALEDLYHEHSQEAEIDPDGRVTLGQELREKIGLAPKQTALFTGAGDTFKIWNPDTYETEQRARKRAFLARQPEGFDPRALLPARKRDEA